MVSIGIIENVLKQGRLKCIVEVRKLTTHNNRIYNYNFKYIPRYSRKHDNVNDTRKIFGILQVMKHLTLDDELWNDPVVADLKGHVNRYNQHIGY